MPKIRPIAIEQKPRRKKSPRISNGAFQVISWPPPTKKNVLTVLNKIIATASLTIPSPKSKLNNVGYSSYLTIEMAAITSVEHKRDDISRISGVERTSASHSLWFIMQRDS